MNITDTEDSVLQRITEEAVKQRLPCIIFIGSLSLIGTIGNLHVLFFFSRSDRKPSTYTVFVIALSLVDFTTCLFHMPMEIFDLTRPYTFYSEVGCRLFRFNNAFLLVMSTFFLLLIALERYRRVCNPLKPQMTVALSKKLCVLLAGISLILSLPMYFLNGHHIEILTENGVNATGYTCFINDDVRGSAFLFIYLGTMVTCFLLSSVIIVTAYTAVSKVVFSRHSSIRENTFSPQKLKNISTISLDSFSIETPVSQKRSPSIENGRIHLRASNSSSVTLSTLKTTRPLFFIAVIFIVVFSPYLVLSCIVSFDENFKSRLSPFELTVYQIAFRLILVNNVANPFVYGFTDERFKNGIKSFYCRNR